jgi:hypothetical protein
LSPPIMACRTGLFVSSPLSTFTCARLCEAAASDMAPLLPKWRTFLDTILDIAHPRLRKMAYATRPLLIYGHVDTGIGMIGWG